MTHQVEVTQNPDSTWNVFINGIPVHDALSGLTIKVEGATKPSEVTLELLDLAAFRAPAQVVLGDETDALLKTLGWTPPASEEERRSLTWWLHDRDWDLSQRADVQEYLAERLENLGGPVSLDEET